MLNVHFENRCRKALNLVLPNRPVFTYLMVNRYMKKHMLRNIKYEETHAIKLIEDKFAETNKNIENIQSTLQNEIADINTNITNHTNRIEKIETEIEAINNDKQLDEIRLQLELIKQDRLRNNIRLTGLPPVAFEDPVDTIMQIESVLKIGLIASDFTAYADRHKSSLIVSFSSHTFKRMFTNELHSRKSLLVEEVFPSIQSNSNIYSNDQLTPYFAKIFQAAWQAKKEGIIYSASSLGGKIKVKVNETSRITIIETEQQLNDLVHNKQPDAAPTQQSNGPKEPRNNVNSNERRNDSIENISIADKPSTSTNKKVIQRPDRSAQSRANHRTNQFSTKRVHSRLQSDIHQQRMSSRDRAFRSDFDFDDQQSTKTTGKSYKNRHSSYRLSPSPRRRSDRNRGNFEPGNSYGRYNRHRY